MTKRVAVKRKTGNKPYSAANYKLMPVNLAAKKLGLDPRTVGKVWNSAVTKLGGDLFVQQPKACELVLAQLQAVDASYDPLQPNSLECLIARGAYIP